MAQMITVFAPASVANVCSGFDVFGIAIAGLGDELSIRRSVHKSTRLTIIGEYANLITDDPSKNSATVPIIEMCKELDIPPFFDVTLNKRMPIGSGLGSSAASAAAGAYALKELLEVPYSKKDLIKFALKGEEVACGSMHADNVAASMYGGAVLVPSINPLQIIGIPVINSDLYFAIVHPNMSLETAVSRKALPDSYERSVVVAQLGRLGCLVAGLLSGDNDYVSLGLHDYLAAPYRSHLIPGYENVVNSAMNEGALGAGISGAGPSIFALCSTKEQAKRVVNSMTNAMRSSLDDVEINPIVARVDNEGCVVTNRL